MTLDTHLFGLPNVSLAGLNLVAVAALAASLFSQCNMAWRRFPWAGSSGCQCFESPRCFISAKYESSASARFWSHAAHTGSKQ
jgi:hypothetical protein